MADSKPQHMLNAVRNSMVPGLHRALHGSAKSRAIPRRGRQLHRAPAAALLEAMTPTMADPLEAVTLQGATALAAAIKPPLSRPTTSQEAGQSRHPKE